MKSIHIIQETLIHFVGLGCRTRVKQVCRFYQGLKFSVTPSTPTLPTGAPNDCFLYNTDLFGKADVA